MKVLLLTFLLFSGLNAFSSQVLDDYSRIELRTLPNNELSENFDLGFFWKYVPSEMYGIYGVKGEEQSADDVLLGKMVMSSLSLGLIGSAIIFSDDDVRDIEDIEGQDLSSLCSRYWGLEIGGTLVKGGTGFSSVNKNGVIIKSSVTTTGLVQILLAGITSRVKCLDLETNENWHKKVWFE